MEELSKPKTLWITQNEHKIHSLHFGKGKNLLIIFHGFADKADLFLKLQSSLENYFEVVAVDLPFHGATEWQNDVFKPADIKKLIFNILQLLGYQRFSLMAHSMGGFIALKIYEKLASLIDNLIMLAPGGIYRALPFHPVLFNSPVRRFFRSAVSSSFLPNILHFTMKVRLLHKSFYEFINLHFINEIRRKRIFNSWVSLYYFHLDLKKIRKLLEQNHTFLCFFYGAKDKITPVKYAEKFIENLPKNKTKIIKIENENHFFIKQALSDKLAEWLQVHFNSK